MIMGPKIYANKVILAPMVRENSLPFRLLCIKYGADLVYTEELIDHRLCKCRRQENDRLKTIDFIDERGKIALRTIPDEKANLIMQIGSCDSSRALEAARIFVNDISGIDFNFGCPKSFSLQGGMGAALLEKPEQIREILSSCVMNLNIPVTCKIRLLPDIEKTLGLVKIIEDCGVSAIAVHGRTKDQRPHDDNDENVLRKIVECLSIPVIANGGSNSIRSYSDMIDFKERIGASSVMVARAAMRNPSIFKPDNQLEPIETVIREFIKLAVRYDNYVACTKYALQTMMSCTHFGGDFVRQFHGIRDFERMCKQFDLDDWYQHHSQVNFLPDNL